MLIEIFDVDHGFCALVTADDGQHVLLDCGRNALTGLSPSGTFRREESEHSTRSSSPMPTKTTSVTFRS